MPRIQEREEETDGDRLDAALAEERQGLADALLIKRRDDAAVAIDPFPNTGNEGARHQGRRRVHLCIVVGLTQSAPHRQEVPESLRGQQAGAREAMCQDGVGGDRRAMDNEAHAAKKRGEIGAEGCGGLSKPLEHRLGRGGG